MSEQAGRLVPLLLSFDGGATYQTLVCLQQFDESLDATIDEQESDCGKISAPGAVGATVNFTAICKTDPEATEVTLQQCKEAIVDGTLIKVKIQNPAAGSVSLGEAIHSIYDAYLSNVTTTKQTSSAITFTGTLNSTGDIDVTVA
jgi:hypothetical protein